jgi:alkanesulfonate monooxygenase
MSKDADAASYRQRVIDVAQWSERAGCRGILVYTDNGIVDPWLVSQIILQNTESICPLVAIQPMYMHPYSVAKMVTTLAFLHGRRVFLNMVAGGFRNDLLALNDHTPHDRRYDRLIEYTNIISGLLEQPNGLTFEGEFYQVRNLKLSPPMPEHLRPLIMMSGSSQAGLAAAAATKSRAIKYPMPTETERVADAADGVSTGIRIGIIARDAGDEAWSIAHERFPIDRRGQLVHELAMKTSDSEWHRQLSRAEERPAGEESPYWMRPFHTYKTFCPYLVGSYERVAQEIASYTALGHRTLILDIPPSEDELRHIETVFGLVSSISY